jgi:hypothetical protein
MEIESTHALGPLAQLRAARRSPGALALGALLGGFVPIASALTAHYGRLLVYEADGLHVATWCEPRWIVVVGGLGFSAKSVYHWTLAAFSGDRLKAGAFVALLECTLLLAPLVELQCAAALYLVLINMLSAGSALALRDQSDTFTPALAPLPQVRSLTAEVSGDASLSDPTDDELYERALAHVRSGGRASGRALRLALGCGTTKAGELAKRLASEASLAECAE